MKYRKVREFGTPAFICSFVFQHKKLTPLIEGFVKACKPLNLLTTTESLVSQAIQRAMVRRFGSYGEGVWD
jgi:hypothetical protein